MNRRLQNATYLLLLVVFTNSTVTAANPDLVARQKWLNAALKKVSPTLVSVQDGMGAGSGVVVSGDGIVLTASHVVETRGRHSPRLQVVFPDGSTYRADLLGMNRSADAAMLKIRDKPRNGSEFPHSKLGVSDDLERGEWCFALGHPGGFKPERPAPVRLGRVLSVGHRTVVTDCAIVLGDSGGPLFNMEGRVIGIHSMITEVIVENRHVAIDVYRRDGDRMEGGESWGRLQARDDDLVETSFFGVTLRWRHFTPEVVHVAVGSPADRARVRSGDVLLTIAGQKFADPLGLNNLLSEVAENQSVTVRLDRAGRERDIRLTTGRRPSREQLRSRRDGKQVVFSREHAIELQQQLTSFRQPGVFEKRSREEMDRFDSVAEVTEGSVVTFRRKLGRNIAFGAVMSSDGYILTKASELEDEIEPECILSTGKRLKVREVAVDRAFDLMLVKVEARNLTPVKWASGAAADRGTIVLTTDSRGAPFLPGVVSVETRALESSKRGFLGIVLGQNRSNAGVLVTEVLPGGAAERARIKPGDSVMSVNGTIVNRREELIRAIQRLRPNTAVTLRYERNNLIKSVTVELTPQFIVNDDEVLLKDRYGREGLGEFVSAHHIGFPEVLEHDTDLFPDQCGGPLFNIHGQAVGLNIARAARITSYAVPASAVERVFRELKARDTGR